MIYNYLRVSYDLKGVDAHTFSEEKALIQSIIFGLIIGCNSKAPVEEECLISSWENDDPSCSCHPDY
jgi:hypothetical protein